MTKAAAVVGSLVDLRNIHTHKCARLVIDVPAEHAANIIAMFGWPTMANPVPVAVARLNMESDAPAQLPPPKAEVKPRKKFESLPYPQQAGMCCAEPEFWAFLRENYPYKVQSEDDATFAIYRICDVESRRDLRPGTLGAEEWLKLFDQYRSRQVAERCGAI